MTYERFTKMQMWKTKGADVTGTELMPMQGKADLKKTKKDTVIKTSMAPHVNVTHQQPPSPKEEVKVAHFAMPSIKRYPLDSYEQVKTACAYFEEWENMMEPSHRREFCTNLVKRAEDLGIEVSKTAARYGASGYSEDVDAMLGGRKSFLDKDQCETLDKLAETRALLPEDVFCAALEQFDRDTGLAQKWDRHVPDPYFSTYGTKTAEADELLLVGTDSVPKRAIANAAKTHMKSIASTFGDELAEEYRKDPVGIFKSLPRDQKQMIMNMVTDNSPNPDTTGSI